MTSLKYFSSLEIVNLQTHILGDLFGDNQSPTKYAFFNFA
jgi:hypothetical protein